MKIAYISGPYRSKSMNGIYENVQRARNVAINAWLRGYAVICPHTNTAFMDGIGDDEMFLSGDLEMVRRSDVVIMVHNWELSEGACEEHRMAKDHNKEIFYADIRGAF